MVGEPGASRAFRADLAVSSTDQAFAITRGEFHPDEPVRAKWSMGARQPTDVIWTRIAAPVFVNDRVIGLLEKLGARGWSTYRIKLFGSNGEEVTGYRGLSVHGRCGAIDNSRSVKIMKRYPGGVFPEWKGLFFDPETWDGSELFMPAGRAGWIFAVDEVRQAFETAKIKNVVFHPLDGIERSEVEMSVSLDP